MSLALGFLSAVGDRFGFWPEKSAAWGNWSNFLAYTKLLNPWFPDNLISVIGFVATALEIMVAIFLLIGFKTAFLAKLSGYLLLLFGLAMTFTIGVKAPLDYSVFSASAAAFGLSQIEQKYLEIDTLIP